MPADNAAGREARRAARKARRARAAARIRDACMIGKMQYALRKQYKTPLLSSDEVTALGFTLLPSFDIDSEDPLDFEHRYFLPAPREIVRLAMEDEKIQDPNSWVPKTTWQSMVAGFEPVEWRRAWDDDWNKHDTRANNAIKEAERIESYCLRSSHFPVEEWWSQHMDMLSQWEPRFFGDWREQDGTLVVQNFVTCSVLQKRVLGAIQVDEDVPHAVISIADSLRPQEGYLLRSELMAAAAMVKTQLRLVDAYIDHKIFPALVISIHGRFSARIIQAYVDNGQFLLRVSRILKLHSPAMTHDVELLIRWFSPRPLGETRYPLTSIASTNSPDPQLECTLSDSAPQNGVKAPC